MHNPRPDIEICPQRDIENFPRALVAAAPQKKSEKSSPLKEILIVARPFKWSFILAGRKIDKKWKQNWAFYGRCILEAQGHFGCCCFHASCARCQINKAGQTSGGRGRWKMADLTILFFCQCSFLQVSPIFDDGRGRRRRGRRSFRPQVSSCSVCMREHILKSSWCFLNWFIDLLGIALILLLSPQRHLPSPSTSSPSSPPSWPWLQPSWPSPPASWSSPARVHCSLFPGHSGFFARSSWCPACPVSRYIT